MGKEGCKREDGLLLYLWVQFQVRELALGKGEVKGTGEGRREEKAREGKEE